MTLSENDLSTDDLAALVGYRFPGGTYQVAHWENWLLTDCTGAAPLPDALVHPVALFHMTILGSRMSIAELFALFRATGHAGVSLLGYDWEYLQPLREEAHYTCTGRILQAERSGVSASRFADTVIFLIEVFDAEDQPVARVTNTWRFNRTTA